MDLLAALRQLFRNGAANDQEPGEQEPEQTAAVEMNGVEITVSEVTITGEQDERRGDG